MSQAMIAVSAGSLLKLPEGAVYRQRSGQAEAELSMRGDTIYVFATCDSLRREVELFEGLYYSTLDSYETLMEDVRTQKEQRSNPVKIALAAFIAGLFVGVLSTVIILTKKAT